MCTSDYINGTSLRNALADILVYAMDNRGYAVCDKNKVIADSCCLVDAIASSVFNNVTLSSKSYIVDGESEVKYQENSVLTLCCAYVLLGNKELRNCLSISADKAGVYQAQIALLPLMRKHKPLLKYTEIVGKKNSDKLTAESNLSAEQWRADYYNIVENHHYSDNQHLALKNKNKKLTAKVNRLQKKLSDLQSLTEDSSFDLHYLSAMMLEAGSKDKADALYNVISMVMMDKNLMLSDVDKENIRKGIAKYNCQINADKLLMPGVNYNVNNQ